MEPTSCVCNVNTSHLNGAERFREITRIIINRSQNIATKVLEPRILIRRISAQSDSNDSGDDEISEEEDEHTLKLAINRPRRHHHVRHHHRPSPSRNASSSSSSNASTPVHRGTSTGTNSSQQSSSTPQSPASSTHQTDESSSPPPRRRTSTSRWSPASLKHALRSLSLNALLLPETHKEKKNNKKRILRSPVAYTYVKGLSGLPTQRVPLRQAGARGCMWPAAHNYTYYPPTAELCCLQRAAALSALCLDR